MTTDANGRGKNKNQKLIDARKRLTSTGGDPMTPQDIAEEMNAFLWALHQQTQGSPEPTTLDHRYVSSYEAGRHWWPSHQYRAAWRHALRVETDTELGFTPKRRRRGNPTSSGETTVSTARLAVAGTDSRHPGATDSRLPSASPATPRPPRVGVMRDLDPRLDTVRPSVFAGPPEAGPPEDIIDVLSRIQKLNRTVDPTIVDHLQQNLRHTLSQYEELDHSSLNPVLLRQRNWIDSLLDECSHPRQRQQLFQIAAATSGVLGYITVGRAAFPLARAYCLEAFHLGEFSEDSNLQAWARGMQSFCEYYARNYQDALDLARDGLTYAQRGSQSVRLAINGVARAMGKLGDVDGVHRAVDGAYELMSHNDVPSGVPSSIALECYSAAQTAGNAATAYVSLGMPDLVQQYVELALPDISASGSPWSRSLVMIDLAFSLVRSEEPDLDRAADLAVDALAISDGRPIISVRQRTSELIRDAFERWGDTRQISAIREAAASTMNVTRS